MRGLQAKAARIIAGAFKSTAGSALNVKLFLLLIEQQLDKAIFNSFLRIKTSSRYEFIISHRTLPDRNLSPNMTQHQRSLYAQLSPLHKLKRRYASILDQSLTPLERHIPFPVAPWWNASQTTIALTAEKAIATHDALLASDGHFIIYTDGSGIDSKIGASAVTMITPIPNEPPIVADKRQAFLDPLSKFTVYCGELVGIDIALNIIKDNPQNRPVAIFTDNQAAILAVRRPGHQSGQYVLVQIVSKIQTLDVTIHIHWIPAHQGVPGNEAADVAAKEATGWSETPRSRPGEPFPREGLHVLTSAVKMDVRFKIQDQWNQTWSVEKHGRVIYKLIKTPTTDVLQKFKSMSKAESSVIVQARTGKIGLRDYLHRIGVEPSPKCPCGAARQTVKHTLLNCPRHDAARGELLQVGDKDLTRLLEIPALAVKVAKFLLATGELHQFRYTHAPANSYERETLAENN